MHFFHSIWKNLHLTEIFYTDMSVVSVTNMRYGLHLSKDLGRRTGVTLKKLYWSDFE